MIRRFRLVMGSFQLRGHIVKTQYSGLSHESCAPDHSTALNVYQSSEVYLLLSSGSLLSHLLQ